MPFTPLHMGPGALLKAALGRRFSLIGFGVSQVVIDLEPLLRMLCNDAVLHGPSHTLVGALVVALVSLPLTEWLYPRLATFWNPQADFHHLHFARMAENPARTALATGCLVGGLSHVLIDGVMHADLQPLWPFTATQPWYGLIEIDQLHLICLLSGVTGLVWLAVVDRPRRRRA